MIAIGRLGKSFGIKGYIYIYSFSNEFDHFKNIKKIFLRKDKLANEKFLLVEDFQLRKKDALIKFKDFDNPEDVKKYTNYEVWVEEEYASPLKDDEIYFKDLINCDVYYKEEKLAKVLNFLEGGKVVFLEVKSYINHKKYILPYTKDFINNIDINNKLIDINNKDLLV